MKLLKYIFLLVLLPCLSGQLCAQTFTAKKQVDQLFKAYAKKSSPGYAIGILKGNKLLYAHGYGMAEKYNYLEIGFIYFVSVR